MGDKRHVEVEDLCLVKFDTKHYSKEVREWQDKAAVPYAESCGYQIWYGTQKDYKDFPYPKDDPNAIETLYDVDAYNFLLEFASGIQSERVGETHIKSQIYEGWRAFSEAHPKKSISFQRLIGDARKDVDFIKEQIAPELKDVKHISTARDLSGQAKGETVLIIPSVSRNGKVFEFTRDIIGLTENKQVPSGKIGSRNNFIRIMPNAPDVLEVMKSEVERLQADKVIKSNIDFVSIDDVKTQLEECDRVYVDLPMGSNSDYEKSIIDAWCGREREDNTLTHMRGTPMLRMGTSFPWDTSRLAGGDYISPENILLENEHRKQRNVELVEEVKVTINRISHLRMEGCRCPHKIIKQENEEADIAELVGVDDNLVYACE